MDHDQLLVLRQSHAAWRLLAADSAVLIVGFLHHAFAKPHARSIPQRQLETMLAEYLAFLNRGSQEPDYSRSPADYLGAWAADDTGYLRKFYIDRDDEPHYDLTPGSEKAIEWLTKLEQRSFIGTESRLLTVVELLRDLARLAETDPAKRIEALKLQREAIESEILEVEQGRYTPGDPRQIKERLFEAEDLSRRLLSDFRQVEDNFRQLDREVRERIAQASAAKGNLLDEVFRQRDAITESDQGRSFAAFWMLLLSPQTRAELDGLIRTLCEAASVHQAERPTVLPRLQDHLLEAGERVQQNNASLIDQLRRFLDDQVWLENKRIMELIHEIEQHALSLRTKMPAGQAVAALSGVRIGLTLPLARGLFRAPATIQIDLCDVAEGELEVDAAALFSVHYIDEAMLRGYVRLALRDRSQVTLAQVCAEYPIEKGLAEVVGYLRLASNDANALISDDAQDMVSWIEPAGRKVELRVPRVVFTEAL